MGRNFNQRPSQLLQIEDECLAFDFDLACTLRLRVEDGEREKRQLEAMMGKAISDQLGTLPSGGNITEITPANFGDQSW